MSNVQYHLIEVFDLDAIRDEQFCWKILINDKVEMLDKITEWCYINLNRFNINRHKAEALIVRIFDITDKTLFELTWL